MKVYIVMGTTGEYSDRCEWPVVAYFDEHAAKVHVYNAKCVANQIEQNMDGSWYDPDEDAKNEYDPDMRMYYTGTTYYVMTVDTADAPQEA
jgi:hypothetical protein